MKVINYFSTFLVAVILFAGCSKNNDEEGQVPSKYITVNTGILTRVNDEGTRFTSGDNLSLYGWTGDKDNPTATTMVVDGIKNTTTDGVIWTSESTMLWKDLVTPHYFAAISPARTAALTSFIALEVVLSGKPAEDDILTAVNQKGVTAKDGAVILSFSHLMSRVIVSLTYKNEFGQDAAGNPITPTLTTATIQVKNTAVINLLAQLATLKQGINASDIPLSEVQATKKYQLVTVPQSITAQSEFIKLKINGKDYIYRPTENIPLEAGKSTVITLTVGRDGIYLGSISVNGWDEGTDHKGEAV